MLAGLPVRELDDHLPTISRTAWHCQSCHFFHLKVSLHQYSTVCTLSRNILHKLVAP